MDAALEPTVHAAPKFNHLRAQVGSEHVLDLARPVQRVDVLVHVVRHVAPKRERPFRQLQVDSVLLAVADKRSKLTAVHMVVQNQKKSFVELELDWSLLHQLPCAVQELREHWRYLKGMEIGC